MEEWHSEINVTQLLKKGRYGSIDCSFKRQLQHPCHRSSNVKKKIMLQPESLSWAKWAALIFSSLGKEFYCATPWTLNREVNAGMEILQLAQREPQVWKCGGEETVENPFFLLYISNMSWRYKKNVMFCPWIVRWISARRWERQEPEGLGSYWDQSHSIPKVIANAISEIFSIPFHYLTSVTGISQYIKTLVLTIA